MNTSTTISGGIKLNKKLRLISIKGYPLNCEKNIVGILFSSCDNEYKGFNTSLKLSPLSLKGKFKGAPKVKLILLFIGLCKYFTMLYNNISIGISSCSIRVCLKT